MTNRTASLLLLFLVALLATGILLALAVRLLEGTAASGPWLAPLIAWVCQVIALYGGRRFILSRAVAASPGRSALTIILLVGGTMAVAGAVGWLVARTIGGRVVPPAFMLALWFVLLWAAVSRRNAQPT
jgi:hypothetical protein